MSQDKPRWQYRFLNFKRAYFLLQEAVGHINTLGQLEKEGLIQRFEYCTELSWKTIKDYLESENVVLKQITPRAILKEVITFNFITKGQVWLDLLDDRNKISHTYDFEAFELVIKNITDKYIFCFEELYEKLSQKLLDKS